MLHRRRTPTDAPHHDRWIVSYADFITLLFAFFVVLSALSEVDKRKMKKFANSVQFAFHFAGSGGTMRPGVFELNRATEDPRRTELIDHLPQWARDSAGAITFLLESLPEAFQHLSGGELTLLVEDDVISVELPMMEMFQSDRIEPRPEALRFLEQLTRGYASVYHELQTQIHLPRFASPATVTEAYQRLASLDYYLTGLYGVDQQTYQAQVQRSTREEPDPNPAIAPRWVEGRLRFALIE
jgi:chemotaxis protein MotB